MRTTPLLGLLLACFFQAVLADPYYTGVANTPYPPGCATLPLRQADLYGNNAALVYDGDIWLDHVHQGQSADPHGYRGQVDLKVWRIGCPEPDRSVVLVEFRLKPGWEASSTYRVPVVGSDGGPMHRIPFELKAEANAWGQGITQDSLTVHAFGDYTGGWDDPHRFTWRYVLDIGPMGQFWDPGFLTEYYNGHFPLDFYAEDGSTLLQVVVPATHEVLEPSPALPLNGRLSGTWVETGAADQGLLLSFSNPVPPAGDTMLEPELSDLSVFLSWYTFDATGKLLWLTGAARFTQGATEVSIPIERVTQGQFLGGKKAERAVVGSVRLRARQCNDLEAGYELGGLDLGTGTMRLQRFEALEVAGYACRDYKARLDSLSTR